MLSIFKHKHKQSRTGDVVAAGKPAMTMSTFDAAEPGADLKEALLPVGDTDDDAAAETAVIARQASIIGVLGAKGGVGGTTLSINLSALLAADQLDTTLFDVNLQQPDVALMLGQQPEFSLSDMVRKRAELDRHVFLACRETVPDKSSRLSFVSPPTDLEKSLETDLSSVPDCLAKSRQFTDVMVVDLPKSLDSLSVSLIDCTDTLLLVTEPSLASITASKRWVKALVDLGYPLDRVFVVVNRAGGKLKHLESEAEQAFVQFETFKLPNAYSIMEQSVLAAEPLVYREPKDSYTKALHKLAAALEATMR